MYCGINKNYHIHINELIDEHDVEIKRLENLSGHTNDFEFTNDQKSIKFWSYFGPYVPEVFYYDKTYATEEHGEINISSDTELLEGNVGG